MFIDSTFTDSRDLSTTSVKHARVGVVAGVGGREDSVSFCAGVQFSRDSLRAFNTKKSKRAVKSLISCTLCSTSF